MIVIIVLANTSIMSHIYLFFWREHLRFSLIGISATRFFTIIIMLYIKSPESIHHLTQVCILQPTSSQFLHPLTSGNNHSILFHLTFSDFAYK